VTRTLLIRGMLVGLLAGVLAFGIARVLGEGPLSAGITFETATEPTGAPPAPELVSRTLQSTAGLATGTLVFAVALGGLYGLPTPSPRAGWVRSAPGALPCSSRPVGSSPCICCRR